MNNLDNKIIFERYKLLSEMPTSLEFASEPKSLSRQLSKDKINKPKEKRSSFTSRNAEWQLFQNPKHHPHLKKIAEFTSKGLDRKLIALDEDPILWRLINMDIQRPNKEGKPEGYAYNKYSIQAEIDNNPDLFSEYKKPNMITVIMTPSGLESKKDIASLSSWMLAHKCGHAVLSFSNNDSIAREIETVLKEYYRNFKQFVDHYSDPYFKNLHMNEVEDLYKPFYEPKYEEIVKERVSAHFSNSMNFYNSIFTFGSARNGTLREQDINEELFAQLMQTGKVGINKLIPGEVYNRMIRNVKDYHYGNEEVISKFEESIQKQYNISIVIEDLLLSAIQNCRGEILFDIVSV